MNVEEITITNQICRACLDIGMDMYHLEEVYHSKDSNVTNLLELLEACASIQVNAYFMFLKLIITQLLGIS